MNREISTESLPIIALSARARSIVTRLLKSKKVIPSDGLPRDWRGLAALANISAEEACSFEDDTNPSATVLALWLQRTNNTASIGQLYSNLQRLDRFDVYDDLKALENEGLLIDLSPAKQFTPECKKISRQDASSDFITFEDKQYNRPQFYHAYVLYAREDKAFVDELIRRMAEQKFRLCTEEQLLPGHATFEAVVRLISERCHRCVLIYSPDFLQSPANRFYTNFAQAVGIESKQINMIPCMYRECELPTNLTFYHKLYYTPPGTIAAYDFWEKLAQSLETPALPRLGAPSAPSQSSVNITEVKSSAPNGSVKPELLALPQIQYKSHSLNNLNTVPVVHEMNIETSQNGSISNLSLSSEKSKKMSKIQKLKNLLKGKKQKQVIMVEN